MHYFRRMRYGTFELTRKPGRERFIRSDGYVMVHARGHRFASLRNHYAFEHRVVAYAKYGDTLPDCGLCGIPLDWSIAVIDHIDEVRTNNAPSNLRPLCWKCNIQRTERLGISYPNALAVEFNGKTLTPTEWAREPGVKVHGATIRKRLQMGATPEQAIYGAKITHNGNLPPKRPPPAPKHTRRNSVNIGIDGELKTSAEWSRDSRCEVSDATLRNRVKGGWPHDWKILKLIEGYSNNGKAAEIGSRRSKLKALKETA
jgi:5-methylcytosine-specific restriction endonuclease McrA